MIADFKIYVQYEARLDREHYENGDGRAPFPHCDNLVLHAPGECEYCDDYPIYQKIRQTFKIAFSGHDPTDQEYPCPAEVRRPRKTINAWGGNVKRPAKLESREVLRQTATQLEKEVPAPVKCGTRRSPDWYCSRDEGHEGPCAAWPVSHEAMATKVVITGPAIDVADPQVRKSFKEVVDAMALGSVRQRSDPVRRLVLRPAEHGASDRGAGDAGGVHGGRASGGGSGRGALLFAHLAPWYRYGERLVLLFTAIALGLLITLHELDLGIAAVWAVIFTLIGWAAE